MYIYACMYIILAMVNFTISNIQNSILKLYLSCYNQSLALSQSPISSTYVFYHMIKLVFSNISQQILLILLLSCDRWFHALQIRFCDNAKDWSLFDKYICNLFSQYYLPLFIFHVGMKILLKLIFTLRTFYVHDIVMLC